MVRSTTFILAIATCLSLVLGGCAKNGSVRSGQKDTVMGIIASDPEFSIMWELVNTAGVRGDLHKRRKHKTAFVPTDAAFQALGPDTLATLTNPDNRAQLEEILRMHIVDGSISAPQLSGNDFGINRAGGTLVVTQDATGAHRVDGVRIIRSIRADNGYVHVLEEVIVPGRPNAATTVIEID